MENNGNGNQYVPENLARVGSSIKYKEEEVQVEEKEAPVIAVAASSLADDTTSLQDLDFQKQQTLYLHQPPQDLAVPQPPQQTLGDSQQNPYLIQHPTTNLVVAQQQAPTRCKCKSQVSNWYHHWSFINSRGKSKASHWQHRLSRVSHLVSSKYSIQVNSSSSWCNHSRW